MHEFVHGLRGATLKQEHSHRHRVCFATVPKHTPPAILVFVDGKQAGDKLTDNTYHDSGYRFHDAMHFAFAAILGWSPCAQSVLGLRLDPDADTLADQCKLEESLCLVIYQLRRCIDLQKGTVDKPLLDMVYMFAKDVGTTRDKEDWVKAITHGMIVWDKLHKHKGGYLDLDLKSRTITFSET